MKFTTTKLLVFIGMLIAIAAGYYFVYYRGSEKKQISSFEECAAAGNPVMESYPRQCRANGQNFVEIIAPPPEPPSEMQVMDGQPVTLKIKESVVFEGGLKVTLTAINDSRCAKDVVCVWAGELAAELQIEVGGKTQELNLGTTTRPIASALGHGFMLDGTTETSATILVTNEGAN